MPTPLPDAAYQRRSNFICYRHHAQLDIPYAVHGQPAAQLNATDSAICGFGLWWQNVRSSAEADVGHASGKVRSGEQITRPGAALKCLPRQAALSAYRGNEPADQIGGSVRATDFEVWLRRVTSKPRLGGAGVTRCLRQWAGTGP